MAIVIQSVRYLYLGQVGHGAQSAFGVLIQAVIFHDGAHRYACSRNYGFAIQHILVAANQWIARVQHFAGGNNHQLIAFHVSFQAMSPRMRLFRQRVIQHNLVAVQFQFRNRAQLFASMQCYSSISLWAGQCQFSCSFTHLENLRDFKPPSVSGNTWGLEIRIITKNFRCVSDNRIRGNMRCTLSPRQAARQYAALQRTLRFASIQKCDARPGVRVRQAEIKNGKIMLSCLRAYGGLLAANITRRQVCTRITSGTECFKLQPLFSILEIA